MAYNDYSSRYRSSSTSRPVATISTYNNTYSRHSLSTNHKYSQKGKNVVTYSDNETKHSSYPVKTEKLSINSAIGLSCKTPDEDIAINSRQAEEYFISTVGLRNLGNTCFMNSTLQCLVNTRLVRKFCSNFTLPINGRRKGALVKAFANLVSEITSTSSTYVAPFDFKSEISRYAPVFDGYGQHDAQEFLIFLLEGLHDDLNTIPKKPTYKFDIEESLSDSAKSEEAWRRYQSREKSVVIDTFVGQLKSTLTCTVCDYKSVTYDPFFDLSVPLPKSNLSSSYSSTINLKSCIDEFTKLETLEGDEKPMCARCKKHQKCSKKFSIQRFPKILVIHLKRFSATRMRKLSTNVSFPTADLNLQPYASSDNSSGSTRYSLYGVINHCGSVYGGHYTAYCRDASSSKWYSYNDTRVIELYDDKNVCSPEAYVLFYQQR